MVLQGNPNNAESCFGGIVDDSVRFLMLWSWKYPYWALPTGPSESGFTTVLMA